MILYLFLRWYVKANSVNANLLWYGMGFAFLVDMFLVSIFVYCLKVLS